MLPAYISIPIKHLNDLPFEFELKLMLKLMPFLSYSRYLNVRDILIRNITLYFPRKKIEV